MSVGSFAVDRGDTISGALRAYGDNPSAFLTRGQGNECFTVAGKEGVIPYRARGGYLHQTGGVIAPDDAQEGLLRAFVEFAGEHRRKAVATRLRRPDAELFARCGFTVNQAGSSYSVYLPEFRLAGPRLAELRETVSGAWAAGLTAGEVAHEDIADRIREWGGREGAGPRRVFAGRVGDRVVAYVAYVPVLGSRPGWLHQAARTAPGTAPGALAAVGLEAVRVFSAERAQWLHLGFTPLAGLGAQYEVGTPGRAAARLLRALAGRAGHPSARRLAHQRIWDPHLMQPGYLAWRGRAAAEALGQLLRPARAL
ncbi:phosphatidylglycerol lysyltransferase domain-containing protein [Streptomyces sp. cg36]|uniref:phosphatidylglycerol lysyltransferase domain-containing protein n=1 Tax=Streptomyces sp. cg36 TaxID=3238798 RepID=UPI0034E21B47